jgi:hypothetical protein
MTEYYVDSEGGDLVVREANSKKDDPIVSDKYTTKFMLCSARCERKTHFGTFDGTTFKCNFYDESDTHPLRLVLKQMKIAGEEP